MRPFHRYKDYMIASLCVTLPVACISKQSENNKLTQPPNIIFILTDDQGWGDISYNGNPFLNTPALNKLAGESVKFNKHYVSTVCAPSRASFLTGRYHLRTGVTGVTGGREVMNEEEVTIAEILKDNGYKTGCFGKWHNGEHYPRDPIGQGFDEFFGFCGGHIGNFFDPQLVHNFEKVNKKGYITDILTDAAIKFIENNRDQPFFCYIPYNAPHAPFQVPDEHFYKFKTMGFDASTAAVYGMCENLDHNLKRLLDRVNELGIENNTVIVFSTDNGPNGRYRFNGGMKGWKGQNDEGGVRVPLYIKWKEKISPKNINHSVTAHIDLFPTLVDLCGIDLPDSLVLDGLSMKSLMLEPESIFPDRQVFTHSFYKRLQPAPGSFRTRQYCYIHDITGPRLYDIMKDPGQQVNLSSEMSVLSDSFQTIYKQWFEEMTLNLNDESGKIIPVGYPEIHSVELPATYSWKKGNVTFKGMGYTHDWIVNWKDTKDTISWKINNINAGNFKVYIRYTCPENSVGTIVQVNTGDQVISQTISVSFNPEPFETADRSARGGVMEKPWKTLEIGNLYIPDNICEIYLTAGKISGEGCDLKSIILEKTDIL